MKTNSENFHQGSIDRTDRAILIVFLVIHFAILAISSKVNFEIAKEVSIIKKEIRSTKRLILRTKPLTEIEVEKILKENE